MSRYRLLENLKCLGFVFTLGYHLWLPVNRQQLPSRNEADTQHPESTMEYSTYSVGTLNAMKAKIQNQIKRRNDSLVVHNKNTTSLKYVDDKEISVSVKTLSLTSINDSNE